MEWRQTGAQQQKQVGGSQRQPASVRPKEADRHPGQTHGHPESQTLDLRARALGSCWSTWGNITCKTPALEREQSGACGRLISEEFHFFGLSFPCQGLRGAQDQVTRRRRMSAECNLMTVTLTQTDIPKLSCPTSGTRI